MIRRKYTAVHMQAVRGDGAQATGGHVKPASPAATPGALISSASGTSMTPTESARTGAAARTAFKFPQSSSRKAAARSHTLPGFVHSDGCTTPAYELLHSGHLDLADAWADSSVHAAPTVPQALVVRVQLPGVGSAVGVQLDVVPRKLTLMVTDKFRLEVPLPFAVRGEEARAKFDTAAAQLTVTCPVVPPKPPPRAPGAYGGGGGVTDHGCSGDGEDTVGDETRLAAAASDGGTAPVVTSATADAADGLGASAPLSDGVEVAAADGSGASGQTGCTAAASAEIETGAVDDDALHDGEHVKNGAWQSQHDGAQEGAHVSCADRASLHDTVSLEQQEQLDLKSAATRWRDAHCERDAADLQQNAAAGDDGQHANNSGGDKKGLVLNGKSGHQKSPAVGVPEKVWQPNLERALDFDFVNELD